jgi:hypothetical protein
MRWLSRPGRAERPQERPFSFRILNCFKFKNIIKKNKEYLIINHFSQKFIIKVDWVQKRKIETKIISLCLFFNYYFNNLFLFYEMRFSLHNKFQKLDL